MNAAKAAGALTIGIANNPGTSILQAADFGVLAETGSEIVAGSTRMKAGTSQKAVLNMISTGIMIELGRVYGSYMVDMMVSNAKLQQRAINMVAAIAHCSEVAAAQALKAANNHIKTAVLMAMGREQAAANAALEQSGGNLRQAIMQIGESS